MAESGNDFFQGTDGSRTSAVLLIGHVSGELPAAVFPEAEENNNNPWLKRPAPRQPGWSHPSENAIAGELKRQIQQLKQKNAGLEKEKLIWQAYCRA
ncbi:hypothetical protein BH006_06915 [Salmonella enterica]|uniref:Uncharacterized protein n=1 Tax=Salmonella enterica TaxID=28901 RepID=A0A3F3I8S4_SALER|nr:hypothetical protein [Salmonella enterica]OEH95578.1 hypothetical protein BH006_06915 [Salmonella enterica]